MRASLLLPVLAVLLPAAPLVAQGRGQGMGQEMGSIDARFAQADRNRDGKLSRGEVTQAIVSAYPGGGRMSTARSRILTNFWFNRLDGDQDNAVTRAEARSAAAEYRARFDRNRNGRIDPRERRAVEAFLRNPAT